MHLWSVQHIAYCENCRYPERDILAIVEEQVRLFARDYVRENPE